MSAHFFYVKNSYTNNKGTKVIKQVGAKMGKSTWAVYWVRAVKTGHKEVLVLYIARIRLTGHQECAARPRPQAD